MKAFIVLTQKTVLWRRNRDQIWSLWEWGGRRDGGEQRLSCGGVPISWPRGPPVTEPWGPHRFVLPSGSLTDRMKSLCATANFICTVWSRLTRPSRTNTENSMALLGFARRGRYMFIPGPGEPGGCDPSSLHTPPWDELTPLSTARLSLEYRQTPQMPERHPLTQGRNT